MLIFGYLDLNTAINSSTSSHASNILLTLLYLQSAMIYDILIIISLTYIGATKLSKIGHIDKLEIGTKYTVHTMTVTLTNLNT